MALLKNFEPLRDLQRLLRHRFANLVDSRLCWSPTQPCPQLIDRGFPALCEHLDRAVRQIARYSPDQQPLGLEPSAVTKIHPLNFPKDEKTSSDLIIQFGSASLGPLSAAA